LEFHAEAHRQLCPRLAQGPYVAARAGVEPTTLRLRVIVSTKAPPCSTVSQLESMGILNFRGGFRVQTPQMNPSLEKRIMMPRNRLKINGNPPNVKLLNSF